MIFIDFFIINIAYLVDNLKFDYPFQMDMNAGFADDYFRSTENDEYSFNEDCFLPLHPDRPCEICIKKGFHQNSDSCINCIEAKKHSLHFIARQNYLRSLIETGCKLLEKIERLEE